MCLDINKKSHLNVNLHKLSDIQNGILIELKGYVDAYCSFDLDNLLRTLDKEHYTNVILDLKDLKQMSSCGVGFVLKLSRLIHNGLVLVNVEEKVLDTMSIIGLRQIITILDSKDDAIAFLKTNNS
jgi:anti-anti-sigma factor